MNIRNIREQLRTGTSIADLPLRVTYYARVSTDKVEQQGSLDNQIQYYTDFIQKNPKWIYVPGYVDEGISGTSTSKRDSFLRMIADANRGVFDFIITKEISRFSRNTLDSIQYTRELLDVGVGVLFQNDNINTLDTDSEFRLVIMAGVAQDEVRKLSERLKFGFRQSIKNGHVLGNDQLWGYDKKGCILTIIPEEAQAVQMIFERYATGQYGLNKLSRELTRHGYTSRHGNNFNTATIGHILRNPKYKGWYCGNKSKSLDYRSKKSLLLDESEWITYPDPSIPAIVSEELWDKANGILKKRSERVKTSGRGYQSRYAYSGKIICGVHGTSFHRQSYQTKTGDVEYWRCKITREEGTQRCQMPTLYTRDLDALMAELFGQVVTCKEEIVNLVLDSLDSGARLRDCTLQLTRLTQQQGEIERKKEKLLELSMADALTMGEFKERNQKLNGQLSDIRRKVEDIKRETQSQQAVVLDRARLKAAMEEELNFTDTISSELVTVILEKMIVQEGSDRNRAQLEVDLRLEGNALTEYVTKNFVFSIGRLRNTTPRQATKTTSSPSAPLDSSKPSPLSNPTKK